MSRHCSTANAPSRRNQDLDRSLLSTRIRRGHRPDLRQSLRNRIHRPRCYPPGIWEIRQRGCLHSGNPCSSHCRPCARPDAIGAGLTKSDPDRPLHPRPCPGNLPRNYPREWRYFARSTIHRRDLGGGESRSGGTESAPRRLGFY